MSNRSFERASRRPSSVSILLRPSVCGSLGFHIYVLIASVSHRCLVDPVLSALASNLITSLVYSHDVVSRLSLGSVKDIRNTAMWLCAANDEEQGYASVTKKARAWKEGGGNFGTPDWVCYNTIVNIC
jgi:hypothetical protein